MHIFFSHVNVCLFITSIGLSYGCHHRRRRRCSRQKRDYIYVVAVNFFIYSFFLLLFTCLRDKHSPMLSPPLKQMTFSPRV